MTTSEEMAGEILELRAKLDRAIDLWAERTDEVSKLNDALEAERKGVHTLLHLAMDAVGRGENLNYHVGRDISPHGGFHGLHAAVQRDLHRLARLFWDHVNGLCKEDPDIVLADYVTKQAFAKTRSNDGKFPI